MKSTDVIVTWPDNCDYPLWRKFIRNNRQLFNEVVIVFTKTNQGTDYRNFVRSVMQSEHIHFIDNYILPPGRDWRDYAVNRALMYSYNAEWIWFTEQDFTITNIDRFFRHVGDTQYILGTKVIGVKQGARLHPCCLFIERKKLEKTRKNFGIDPGRLDHFGLIQEDLEALRSPIYTLENDFMHYNGLSHNYRLIEQGEAPNYEPEKFIDYLKQCVEVDVEKDPRFMDVITRTIAKFDVVK